MARIPPKLINILKQEAIKCWPVSSQYVHTASVNHIGSAYADRLSRHPAPAGHYSDTLQAGVKPPCCYITSQQLKLLAKLLSYRVAGTTYLAQIWGYKSLHTSCDYAHDGWQFFDGRNKTRASQDRIESLCSGGCRNFERGGGNVSAISSIVHTFRKCTE